MKFEDGNAEIKKEGEENVEKKDVEGMKSYIASKYSDSTEHKEIFVRIIQSVDDSFITPDNFDTLDKDGLKALITNEHIQGILEKQIDYSKNGSDIDGKPGGSFIKILDNEVISFDDMKTKAIADYTRIEQVLTDLNAKLGDDVGKEKIDYLKSLKPGTINERNKYENASENEDESKVIDQNVGAWSEGCQVVFGPEKFYEFWDNVTNKGEDSGQRRWYYTIIDAETLKTETKEETE